MNSSSFLYLLLISGILYVPAAGNGQNFNFSQYLNTSGRNNPSQASLEQETAVRLNYRVQGVGGQQSMQSAVLNAYYPWLATRRSGPTSTIGLMVLDDKLAPANGLSYQSIGLSLSYAFSLSIFQRLSFGLMPAYGFHKMNESGFRTMSQYSYERGYSPSLPLNEPLLNAQAKFLAWNAGVSWLQKDRSGKALSSAGFAIQNINQPAEVFETFENTIPLATQAFFFTTAYQNHLFQILPETFFSSYGNSYQLQVGGTLKYNLRYSSFRQGSLNFFSRYNLLKSVIFGAQWEQPAYEIGFSSDIYVHRNSPFSQAFEVSFALKQGVEGRNWKFNRKKRTSNKNKKNRRKGRKDENFERDKKPGKDVKISAKEKLNPAEEDKHKYDKDLTFSPLQKKGMQLEALENHHPVIIHEIPERTKIRNGAIMLGSAARNIHFESGSVALTPSSIDILKDVALYLKTNPAYNIIIVGHTDDVGGKQFNQQLSLERAKAVEAVLLRNEVQTNQISTEGAGMGRPLLPNTSETNRRLNRRVEFLLYKD